MALPDAGQEAASAADGAAEGGSGAAEGGSGASALLDDDYEPPMDHRAPIDGAAGDEAPEWSYIWPADGRISSLYGRRKVEV